MANYLSENFCLHIVLGIFTIITIFKVLSKPALEYNSLTSYQVIMAYGRESSKATASKLVLYNYPHPQLLAQDAYTV